MAEISRRALLSGAVLAGGAGIGALLGLSKSIHHRVAIPPPAPPSALTAALASQRNLLAGYDRLDTSQLPARAGLRSDVQAHGDALLALLELYPGWRLSRAGGSSTAPAATAPAATAPAVTGSAASSESPAPPATVAALAAASRAAAAAVTTSCLHWPAGEEHAALVVPVLGSIAACLDTHVQVLSG